VSTQQAETYQIIYRLINLYTPHVTAENRQDLISSEVHITNRVLAVPVFTNCFSQTLALFNSTACLRQVSTVGKGLSTVNKIIQKEWTYLLS